MRLGQQSIPARPSPARHGPALLPALLRPCCGQCFPFPLTFGAFPASKCQAHKERHCERKMERECLPASLRKCCLTLHQGSLCKRGTRLTTSSLCWPATAAAPPLNTLFFSPCAVFAAWVTAFLADTERRGAVAAGALHCAASALGWMWVPPDSGMLGGVPALPTRCCFQLPGINPRERRVSSSAGVGQEVAASSPQPHEDQPTRSSLGLGRGLVGARGSSLQWAQPLPHHTWRGATPPHYPANPWASEPFLYQSTNKLPQKKWGTAEQPLLEA